MFTFFLQSYRSGLLTFCGSKVETEFDPNGEEAKFSFRSYDNGDFKFKIPRSRHPNLLKAVIIGKKSWGLWLNQWTDGIVEWSFTKEEILNQFYDLNIQIPPPLLRDFENTLLRKKIARNESYLKDIGSS